MKLLSREESTFTDVNNIKQKLRYTEEFYKKICKYE